MNNPVVHKMPGTTRAQALEHWGIDGLRLGISVGGSSNTREWEAEKLGRAGRQGGASLGLDARNAFRARG